MKNKIKLIAAGVFTGFCNGLFGSGGGMIAVPCLERYAELEPKKAHSTAILIILPLSVISILNYRSNVELDMKTLFIAVAGGVAGSFAGAKWLKKLSSDMLRKVFAIFILIAAVRMVIT